MTRVAYTSLLAVSAFAALIVPVYAGSSAPAPLLGAGLPGLAMLGAAGVGYVVMRIRRKK